MEFFNGIMTAVHEEFFGNLVGAQSMGTTTTAQTDYISDWSILGTKGN